MSERKARSSVYHEKLAVMTMPELTLTDCSKQMQQLPRTGVDGAESLPSAGCGIISTACILYHLYGLQESKSSSSTRFPHPVPVDSDVNFCDSPDDSDELVRSAIRAAFAAALAAAAAAADVKLPGPSGITSEPAPPLFTTLVRC